MTWQLIAYVSENNHFVVRSISLFRSGLTHCRPSTITIWYADYLLNACPIRCNSIWSPPSPTLLLWLCVCCVLFFLWPINRTCYLHILHTPHESNTRCQCQHYADAGRTNYMGKLQLNNNNKWRWFLAAALVELPQYNWLSARHSLTHTRLCCVFCVFIRHSLAWQQFVVAVGRWICEERKNMDQQRESIKFNFRQNFNIRNHKHTNTQCTRIHNRQVTRQKAHIQSVGYWFPLSADPCCSFDCVWFEFVCIDKSEKAFSCLFTLRLFRL